MKCTHLSAFAFLLSSSKGSVLEIGANLARRAFFFASSSTAVVGLGIPNLYKIKRSTTEKKIKDQKQNLIMISEMDKTKNLSALAFLFSSSDFIASGPCDVVDPVPNLQADTNR
ncbi:hypothetical protein RJT34_16252 [Clitoria ternatea]|uniref:Uncharacterized protein n=1 Tax=Clitoria ternatea TaxID=43366 RepID=A0AAN9PDH5_CLITE